MSARKSAALVLLAAGLAVGASAAQAAPAASPTDLCQGGQLVVVRVNTIKPGATAAYEKAARDHLAWYRAHGVTANRLLTGPVISGGPAGFTASETEYVSIHIDSPGVPRDQRDAAWDAYVKAYRDASELTVDKFACVREPK
ncbi:MAG: hypothetical protein AB1942_23345 [Pseudomonadota bacterium]